MLEELNSIIEAAAHECGYFNDISNLSICGGDLQSDIAIRISWREKADSIKIAKEIVKKLSLSNIGIVQAMGGYITINLSADQIVRELENVNMPLKSINPKRILIDYSNPDIARTMNLGHFKSTCIGDALANILEFNGHEITRENHIGDFGLHFGLLMAELYNEDIECLTFPRLERAYIDAQKRFNADFNFRKRVHEFIYRLQIGGNAENFFLKKLTKISMPYFYNIYSRLGSGLNKEQEINKSKYAYLFDKLVNELISKRIASFEKGAVVCYTSEYSEPLIICEDTGTYLYSTSDIAALYSRATLGKYDTIIYVHDAKQKQYFDQIFEIAQKAGWLTNVSPIFVPFKTGETLEDINIQDFMDQATMHSLKTNLEIANIISIGAIKFNYLSQDRTHNYYIPQWDRIFAVYGDTASYIQYAYARICDIFKKNLEPKNTAVPGPMNLEDIAELNLAKIILQFPLILKICESELKPHHLCTYLCRLTRSFGIFYNQCPILGNATRLQLSAKTLDVLAEGLNLLGIKAPEEM